MSQQIDRRLQRADRREASPTTVPPHNPDFVGRIEDLRQLRHTLEQQPVGAIVGVQGIGGIGKSELAFTYAHAYADAYPGGRFLLTCEGVADVREAMLQLDGVRDRDGRAMFQLSMDDKRDLERSAMMLRNQIVARGRCLIIMDNVTEPQVLAPAMLNRILPDRRSLHVLVTSRIEPTRFRGVTCLALDALQTQEALRLLERHRALADDGEMTAATTIVNLLGGHPLACEVVAIYMDLNPDVTYEGYLQWMRQDLMEALAGAGGDPRVQLRRHPQTLLEPLLRPTVDTLTVAARRAASFASRLHPDHVPMSWLKELVQADEQPNVPAAQPGRGDPWQRVVRELEGRRLLTEGPGQVHRMHRLVGEVIRGLDEEAGPSLRDRIEAFVLERAKRLHDEGYQRDRQWEIGPVMWYARHRLQERTVSESVIDTANYVSAPMREQAMYTDARAMLLETVAAIRREWGADHPTLAISYSKLAVVERDLGNLQEARQLHLQAIEIGTKHLDADHPEFATCYNNLAGVESALGNLQEARQLCLQAIEIGTKHFDADHPNLATRYNNLAGVERALGNLQEARRLYLQAIEIDTKHFDADHPTLATSYNNLAGVERALGNLQEARYLARLALDIRRKRMPPGHPYIAASETQLGSIESQLDEET